MPFPCIYNVGFTCTALQTVQKSEAKSLNLSLSHMSRGCHRGGAAPALGTDGRANWIPFVPHSALPCHLWVIGIGLFFLFTNWISICCQWPVRNVSAYLEVVKAALSLPRPALQAGQKHHTSQSSGGSFIFLFSWESQSAPCSLSLPNANCDAIALKTSLKSWHCILNFNSNGYDQRT